MTVGTFVFRRKHHSSIICSLVKRKLTIDVAMLLRYSPCFQRLQPSCFLAFLTFVERIEFEK